MSVVINVTRVRSYAPYNHTHSCTLGHVVTLKKMLMRITHVGTTQVRDITWGPSIGIVGRYALIVIMNNLDVAKKCEPLYTH